MSRLLKKVKRSLASFLGLAAMASGWAKADRDPVVDGVMTAVIGIGVSICAIAKNKNNSSPPVNPYVPPQSIVPSKNESTYENTATNAIQNRQQSYTIGDALIKENLEKFTKKMSKEMKNEHTQVIYGTFENGGEYIFLVDTIYKTVFACLKKNGSDWTDKTTREGDDLYLESIRDVVGESNYRNEKRIYRVNGNNLEEHELTEGATILTENEGTILWKHITQQTIDEQELEKHVRMRKLAYICKNQKEFEMLMPIVLNPKFVIDQDELPNKETENEKKEGTFPYRGSNYEAPVVYRKENGDAADSTVWTKKLTTNNDGVEGVDIYRQVGGKQVTLRIYTET